MSNGYYDSHGNWNANIDHGTHTGYIEGCDDIMCCLACLGTTLATLSVLLTGYLVVYVSRKRGNR